VDVNGVHEPVKKLSESLEVTDFSGGTKQRVVADLFQTLHAFIPCR
jgi:hypothetical protein